MNKLVVAKYGGSSMAGLDVVAENVLGNPDQVFIAVSALGKDRDDPSSVKVTDQLFDYNAAITAGNTALAASIRMDIISRHEDTYSALGSKTLRRLGHDAVVAFRERPDDPFYAEPYCAALGERFSARYFAAHTGLPIVEDWVLFGRNGDLWRGRTKARLAKLYRDGTLDPNQQVVSPGYYGRGPGGEVFTLPRGGTDRTQILAAAAIGKVFGDENVIAKNYTDVNGIFSIDPRLYPKEEKWKAIWRPTISIEEIRESANGGNGVLQGDAVVDRDGSAFVIVVLNTFNTSHPGTRVVDNVNDYSDYSGTPERPIIAISGRKLYEIALKDLGMSNKVGYLRDLIAQAARHGLSIDDMPASKDAVTFTLNEDTDQDRVAAFMDKIRPTLLSPNAALSAEEKGIVHVVGEHLMDPIVRARTFSELARIAAEWGCGLDDFVSNRLSPSIAMLVEAAAVEPLQREIHRQLVEAA